MATVQLLIDRVSYFTGLDPTNDTQDSTVILSILNETYLDACDRSGCTRTTSASAALTSGTWQYTLSAAPFSLTNINRIIDVYLSDTSVTEYVLQPLSSDQIRTERSGVAQAAITPRYYATPDPTTIWFHPPPGSGTTCYMDYEKNPLTLVTSGASAGVSETTPSAFPARWHYPILANGAIALAMEYDKQVQEATYFWNKYNIACDQLAGWVNEFTGPRGNQLDGFYTSRRMTQDQSQDNG